MAGHLTSRIFTAATHGIVRQAAPVVVTMARAATQLVLLAIAAGAALVGVWWAGNHGVADYILKPVAVILVLAPCLFALIVAAEQIRITYAKAPDVVYPTVDVFPDREPT